MKYEYLSDSASIKTISEDGNVGVFEIEGLYTGYGVTVGNALRRVLLSSLPGGAITQIKVGGVSHEFSTIPGVAEDMVEIILNLKRVRFRIHTSEPQILSLKFKGEGKVTAGDIEGNSEVEVITSDAHIATVTDKGAEFSMELTIEKGLGYVPAEARRSEKLPIGVIALDAIFSPVTKVNFDVENMRVGDRTDYNRLRITIETDGSITPSQALRKSARILQDFFTKIGAIEATEPVVIPLDDKKEGKKKRAAKKAKSKKGEETEADAAESEDEA
ncbi:MAG: DNA-directed RNA polymerase subunit alpha [Patescibacteria group bacterium]